MKIFLPIYAFLLSLVMLAASNAAPQHLPESSAAYIYWGNTWLPISWVQEGRQQLINPGGTEGESQWYFEVQDKLGLANAATQPKGTALHQIKEAYTGPQTPFAAPTNPDDPTGHLYNGWIFNEWYRWDIMQRLAIQGDWQPFTIPIRYEVYTPDDQPAIPEAWDRHFRGLLGDAAANTPLLIKDAYYFDIDGDGREEAVVNAGNLIKGKAAAGPDNLPANESCTSYILCSYFAGDGSILNLSQCVIADPNRPISLAEKIYAGYQPPTPETLADPEAQEQWYEQWCAAYQYNAAGQCVLCPIYNLGEYMPYQEVMALVADIDGDGQPELITASNFIYWPIEIYKFTPGQALPSRQFGINTPA